MWAVAVVLCFAGGFGGLITAQVGACAGGNELGIHSFMKGTAWEPRPMFVATSHTRHNSPLQCRTKASS